MEISEKLRCLFSAEVESRDGSYVVSVPEQELQLGYLAEGESYRVALLSVPAESETRDSQSESTEAGDAPVPPVTEGETRDVEIEDIGDQGDGITRVERGFVVIVPDTDPEERVTIEITEVRENVAFAEVIEREDYFH